MNTKYYLVRAQTQSPEDFDIFLKNDVVAVGWSEVDFTKYVIDDLVKEVEKTYYSNKNSIPQVVGKKKNEVRRFKGIKRGDCIIVPYPGAICLAKAEEQELYSSKHCDNDLANQRKVIYERDNENKILFIPRDKLKEGLQTRLRVRGTTISDLWEFSDEIERLFKGEDYDSNFNQKQTEAIEKFKKELRNNIQSGKTNLESGGRGLEKLIKELLELEGYNADILSKQFFPGLSDADIKATKEDLLSTNKLLIQVKHHSGMTGTWGAKQLTMILDSRKDLFAEYRLVLITSATPEKELIEMCVNNDIKLISGDDLVEWIYKSLPKMCSETKKCLSVSDIPTIL